MRSFLGAVLIALLAVSLTLFAPLVYAGEPNAIGCMVVSDGGSVNNATTGYASATGGPAAAFDLGGPILITLQCMTGPCSVAVGVNATDAGRGLYLGAKEKITSSIGAQVPNVPLPDGGTYRGGLVALAAGEGASSARLCVFPRTGNE
jgi:hypothetical protein